MAQDKKEPKPIRLAHISDIHVGSQYFIANLMSKIIEEINTKVKPHAVIVTGDLTDDGFRQEYTHVQNYLKRIECPNIVCVPGNHDSRNVGYLHFEEIMGPRSHVSRVDGMTIVGVDSSEPDLESGRVGRERYLWIKEVFDTSDFKVFVLHHHLIPVPGTGRERNIVHDAGDLLQTLVEAEVDLVLTGHKHVSHVWCLENLIVATAGTAASLRLRGKTKPCYNIIELEEGNLRIYRKYPFTNRKELVVEFAAGYSGDRKWERAESRVKARTRR